MAYPWEQVKNTMLITLWVFIGVEGAVVVSARARNKRDVGKATLLAVLSRSGRLFAGNNCFRWAWWHVLNWLKFVTRQWPV